MKSTTMEKSKTYTIDDFSKLFTLHASTVRKRLKHVGYHGDLIKGKQGRFYNQEVYDYLKAFYSPKIEIVEVPVFVEVHNNYYIYESKINKL